MRIKTSLFGALLCLLAQPVLSDPVISYTMDDFGGGQYQYNFTVDNTTGAFDIESFSIFFEYSFYENLSITASAADWDPLVIQPDTGIPDDGLADWLALGLPIGMGEILSGFSVAFDWIGTDGLPPIDQLFSINDPFTFDPLFFGLTMFVENDDGPSVPEPGTLGLFSLALMLALITSRKKVLLRQ